MSDEYVEVQVIADRGMQYGAFIPNPDPSKPPINMLRLYEKGEVLHIRKEDVVDFEALNKKARDNKGHQIEVTYRLTNRKVDAVSAAKAAGVDVDALKKQLMQEMMPSLRDMFMTEMNQQNLAKQNMVAAPGGRSK